jgi:undecaprenyl diphosphate synthase
VVSKRSRCFAFSSENWQRPAEEVSRLMELFIESMDREVDELDRNGICLRFIGDAGKLRDSVRERIRASENRTRSNSRMTVFIALSYGGRWDIVQAARRIAARAVEREIKVDAIDETMLGSELQLAGTPEPDLFIRTGGEQRISNFLLWNLAYTELYFCDTLWPDFRRCRLEMRDGAISRSASADSARPMPSQDSRG